MRKLEDLIQQLNTVNWSNLELAHIEIEVIFNFLNKSGLSLNNIIQSISSKEFEIIARKSVETPTHYKWRLYENEVLGYNLWLHEYKNNEQNRTTFVYSIHDHRYWFTSLILKGGFTHNEYDSNLVLTSEEHFVRNKIYTLNPNILHSLSAVKQDTLTLVLQSRAVKPFSTSYDPISKKPTEHKHFISRFTEFQNLIK